MRKNLMLLAAIFLSGCTAKYQLSSAGGSNVAPLAPASSVYVALPKDGAYESRIYGGSGQMVAQAIATAVSPHVTKLQVAEAVQDIATTLVSARDLGARYAIIPTITNWEPRATEWSGKPSRMALRLAVLDVASGEQLSVHAIEARSQSMSITSTSPESLLKKPLADYARQRFVR